MILPDQLYKPARLAENPPELLFRRVQTPFVIAGETVNFARWPRDRLFIVQHMLLTVIIQAAGGQSAALVRLTLATNGVELFNIETVTNGLVRAPVPDYSNTAATADGIITPVAGSARGTFNLNSSLRGVTLPFGASLDLSGSVTGVGSTWSVRADYSGFVIDRGNLIGGA